MIVNNSGMKLMKFITIKYPACGMQSWRNDKTGIQTGSQKPMLEMQ